ncbi:nuclear transport factor 2 family protein [Sandarakinorhabdus sp.]|uniref:nuclear transport factor 2 family protein n=1 Tax=Sandarakinorhabdus sp. TaxID=1916663 RepID=UPI0033417F7E
MAIATPAAADAIAEIKAARSAYNAAIAARDVAGVRAALGDEYIGLAGTGGEKIIGADAMADYFARAFKTPGFLGFVRMPDVVTMAVPPLRAMERGHWSGGSTSGRVSGEYLAVWVPTATGWKLRSETFVTLANGAS